MRVTTKGRYALRAVLALAVESRDGKPVSIKTIAEREDISAEFLEQIFFKLRRAGVIRSVRGPGGGFYFARSLDSISLLDILEASGEGIGLSPCACGKKSACDRSSNCHAGVVWRELEGRVRDFAESRTLADMVKGA
ncbi:MAG: RrF2 family transcriptional regulator [Rectinemataceae bacterium]